MNLQLNLRKNILRSFTPLLHASPHASNIAVDEKNIIETSFAWILPWNDRRYLETGERRFALLGNQPLVVLKADGTFMQLPILRFRSPEWIKWKSAGPHGTIEHRIAYLAEKLGYGSGDGQEKRGNCRALS